MGELLPPPPKKQRKDPRDNAEDTASDQPATVKPPLPDPPEQEVKTHRQFKDKLGQEQVAQVIGSQIMGPIDPGTGPKSTAEVEERQYSNREAAEMAWLKQSIWQFENRPRGRTSQVQIGPSEIGSECDRKLVYRLQEFKPVAHSGGPNWPAIVGTGIHLWMANMMEFLDQERGRYLIEHGVEIVQGEMSGTLDVYDRLEQRVRDWKFPSKRNVRKYKLEGLSETYRVQGHVYAYGLTRQGEKVKDIAINMIARDASSVEEGMHTVIYDYKPSEAHKAVERLAKLKTLAAENTPLQVEPTPSYLCNFCPFYSPTGVKGACPGR